MWLTKIEWSKPQAIEVNNSFFFFVQIPLNGRGSGKTVKTAHAQKYLHFSFTFYSFALF